MRRKNWVKKKGGGGRERGKNLGLNRNPLCSMRLGDSGMRNADGRVCSCPFLFFSSVFTYTKMNVLLAVLIYTSSRCIHKTS